MRGLTAGEREMVRQLFGTSVDAGRVRVHARGYLPWQRRVAMAPNGSLYLPAQLYREDYAQAPARLQCLFVHEMTHVWQYQLGYRVRWAGVCLLLQGGYWWRDCYAYRARTGARLADFNMEQQAELVARFHGARYLCLPALQAQRDWLERVLADFLADPADRRLLPASRRLRA